MYTWYTSTFRGEHMICCGYDTSMSYPWPLNVLDYRYGYCTRIDVKKVGSYLQKMGSISEAFFV